MTYIINDIGYKEVKHQTDTFGLNTDVVKSCMVMWKAKAYLFGGYRQKRQISVLSGNPPSLKRIESLFFEFVGGACTATSSEIVLCFPSGDEKRCYTSKDGTNFNKMASSIHEHHSTQIEALDDGK